MQTVSGIQNITVHRDIMYHGTLEKLTPYIVLKRKTLLKSNIPGIIITSKGVEQSFWSTGELTQLASNRQVSWTLNKKSEESFE